MPLRIVDEGTHFEVSMTGFVSAREAHAHFDLLGRVIREQRRRLGSARVVVDTTGSQPQSGEVAQIMSFRAASIYEDTDRVAVVASSALLSLQIRRVNRDRAFPIFGDREEARAYAVS